MNIGAMNKPSGDMRGKFVDRAEELGGSMQLEFYKSVRKIVEHRHDELMSTKLAAALANYVFRFGLVVPEHAKDKRLMDAFMVEKKACLSAFGDIFKTNTTGVLILLAAAWKIEITRFERHMTELARYGFIKTGKETPNVSQDLPESDIVYMYTLVSRIESTRK